jgi:two-component system response regulator
LEFYKGALKIESLHILLVEDNLGDIRLTREAFKEAKIFVNLHVVMDGIEALAYLKKQGKYEKEITPDLILLDLNLPLKDGREVLAEIKSDTDLKRIPVIVLSTSENNEDLINTYNLHANCYIVKPLDFEQFIKVVTKIEDFWLTIVRLPNKNT